jgi:NADPH:quinone reductase-like Zn-dependent oxidoreductase/malonyl CoA-acyl carrier protein transacylase
LKKDAKTSLINEAHISQPACTAIQLALTDLLRSWGILPTAVAGHSSGEIAAAYAADILTLDSCMAISYYRGMATIRLKKNFPDLKGAMMAVGSSKEEIMPLIAQLTAKEVSIACYNSPTSLTISGDEPAIDELQALMEQQQMFNRKLLVDVAYHSHHMKLVAEEYRASLESLDLPKSTPVKFHSSLLGHLIDGSKLEPSYWVDNLTQSVRFSEALTTMCEPTDGHKTGVNMIVEIGPHSALAGPVKQILKSCGDNAMKIPYASALVRKRDAVETTLELASALFVKGAALDLGAVNLPRPSKTPSLLVDMPRYPWNHQTKYWHESRMAQKSKNRTAPRNDLLGTLANYSNDLEPTWRNILRIDDLPWLRDHKIHSLSLFPMSGFVAMAVEAASQRATSRSIQYDSFELREVSVIKPLIMTDDDVEMTLQLRPYQEGSLINSDVWDEFRINSWTSNQGWTEHCKGLIAVKRNNFDDEYSEALVQSTIKEIIEGAITPVEKTKIYESLLDIGVSYGPSFQGMNNCQVGDSYSTANIMVADTKQDMPKEFQTSMVIHPAFLEQLIEMYWPILGAGRTAVDTVYLPSSIGHMTISSHIAELTKTPGDTLRAFCRGTLTPSHPKPTQVSMFAAADDDSKKSLIMLKDLMISPIPDSDMPSTSEAHRELCYKLDWEPISMSSDSMSNGVSNGVSENSNEVFKEPNDSHNFLDGEVAIIHGDSELQIMLASKLADALEKSTGKTPEVGTLLDVQSDGKLCLFLPELEKPLLSSLKPAQFTALQKLLTGVQGIFWVVRGAYVDSCNPDSNMITGLSRSIRSETLLKFATLDLDSEYRLSEDATVKTILEVFQKTFGSKSEPNCELEFMERKGSLFTPRIINDTEMNEYVHKETKPSALEKTLFIQDVRPLKLAITMPGSIETLHFIDQSTEESLLDDEIEIEVKAIGMNHRDVMTAMGQLETYNFGEECSGIITRVGINVTNFTVGNRIACISVSGGAYSTYARANAGFAFRITDDMSFEAAASIPVAYCTAYYGLIDLGRLSKEDRVLIHGATSAAGQAAICLAQMTGAEVFATVEKVENKQVLKEVYGLKEDQIFSNHNSSFESAIRRTTEKSHFDVVLNCVPTDNDTLQLIWDSLSSFGRFVVAGKQDSNARLETARFEKNRSFMSVDLDSMAVERPKIMRRLVSNISELLTQSQIRPVGPIKVFPISDVETAFRTLQTGNIDGKLVVSPQPADEVKVYFSPCIYPSKLSN